MINRVFILLISFTLVSGALLTAWGIVHMAWPKALPWAASGFSRYVFFIVICTALVAGGCLSLKRNALIIGAAIAVALALLAGALWPLLVTLWFALASALLGKSILARLHIKLAEESWLVDFLVGAGLYGTAVGLLAHFPVNYPGLYGAALALPIILNWRVVIEAGRKPCLQICQKDITAREIHWLDVAIAVVALIYFTVALMPEVAHDALATHLFVPAHLALRHQWGFDVSTYVWAVIPMLGDWIFSIGYMLAGETAVRQINIGFIFILAWLIRDIVLWAGGSPVGARWAVLIFLSTPLTFLEGSSLFIESVWSSFIVAGLLCILRSATAVNSPKLELPIAGLFLGCALAAKAVTLAILPVLLIVLIWRGRLYIRQMDVPSLSLCMGFFLGIGLIPYAFSWWVTNNPVFPFFNGIFKSPYYPAVNFEAPAVFEKGLTWDVLYRITFESGKYLEAMPGASGFQWMLLFIPGTLTLVALRQRKALVLCLVGVAIVAAVFHSTSYLRYVFPAWVILISAIGVAWTAISTGGPLVKKLWLAIAILTVFLNVLFLNAGARYSDFPLKSIGDKFRRESYLSSRLPIRNAVEAVNSLNIHRRPVAVFSSPQTGGLSADALYPNWYNHTFQGEVASIKTEDDILNILIKRNVDFVILNADWGGVGGARGQETLALIEKVTEKIAEFWPISVRRIKVDRSFKTELLVNPDFTSVQGWNFAPESKYDSTTGVVWANVNSAVTQMVTVSAGRRYLNEIVARCSTEKTAGRVQINWLDSRGRLDRADIKTFECTPDWTKHAMEVTAPANAANALVYVTGHSSIPLEFKSSSFRQ